MQNNEKARVDVEYMNDFHDSHVCTYYYLQKDGNNSVNHYPTTSAMVYQIANVNVRQSQA